MSGWFQGKSGETEAAKKAAETGPSIQERAIEAKDQTIGFIGEKSEAVTKAATDTVEAATDTVEAAKKMAADTGDAARQKSTETAQYVQDSAAQFTKESPAAPKEPTGNMFQQAGGQVMGAAVGAKDAVMNTLGMGGDKADAGSTK